MKRKFLLAMGIALFTGGSISAQEINIGIRGGMSGLSYKVSNGDSKILFGGDAQLGFTYWLNSNWGLSTGIGLGYNASKATIANAQLAAVDMVDDQGYAFELRESVNKYAENQSFYALTAPLKITFKSPIAKKTDWFLHAGGMAIFPFSLTYKTTVGQATTTGYYPDVNVILANLPQHGFGTLNGWSQKSRGQVLKTGFALTAETGFGFQLMAGKALYLGIYADYCVTDMRKPAKEKIPLLSYSPSGASGSGSNSILATANSGTAKLLSYGILARLGFDCHKKQGPKMKGTNVSAQEQIMPVVQVDTFPKKQSVPMETEAHPPPPIFENTKWDTENRSGLGQLTEAEMKILEKAIVFGEMGKKELPDSLGPHLDKVAILIKKYDYLNLKIIGHTCDIGSHVANLKLGQQRAESVAGYLISKGVPASRLNTSSIGESEPLFPNNNEENRQRNRFVEILVL